jgi:tetratricopeptide (TPR) repeat protein
MNTSARGLTRMVLAVAWILSVGRIARADTPPSTWDIARDPAERDRWALHRRVDRLLHPPPPEDPMALDSRQDDELRLESARILLEESDAAHSPDVRLRFDLGTIYEQLATIDKRNDLQQKVVDVLAPALEEYPDGPAATDALEGLVYAYAKLDRPKDELATWRRYIPRVLDDRARVAPLMNMGEAEMRLGLLDDALATFYEGMSLCEALPNSGGINATYALTLWDVALVLDRNGDSPASLEMASRARAWTWTEVTGAGAAQMARTVTGWDVIRDENDVFFVPDWEREWYLALGDAASARQASDARDAALLWQQAETHWDAYIGRSTASGRPDPWIGMARTRQERVHTARVKAEKRASALPPRKAVGTAPWDD